ncbi:MAG: hypothetical protein AAFU85_15850 [Planctomycetota bacterium]
MTDERERRVLNVPRAMAVVFVACYPSDSSVPTECLDQEQATCQSWESSITSAMTLPTRLVEIVLSFACGKFSQTTP